MKNRARWLQILWGTILFALLATAWVAFAPAEVGGAAGYVIVDGNSMEPVYQRGDLVVVRASDAYQVGDIVAYRYPNLGRVIHRIIANDGNSFVLKGDNNGWTDSYHPTSTDIIGKAWIHLPSVGQAIEQLRQPTAMALLAAVLGIVGATAVVGGGERHRGRRRNGETFKPMRHLSEFKEGILLTLGLVGLASLGLALFAFTRPISQTVPDNIEYEHTGIFSYSAPAPAGIYDSPTATTGEPIFRQLTHQVNVAFAYNLVSSQPSNLRGTVRVTAQVSDSSGWRQTLLLKPDTSFGGTAFSTTAVLSLDQVQSLIDRVERQTGIARSQYTLALVPEVALTGTLAEHELRDTFSPYLNFTLDRLQMQLARADPGDGDPLKPSSKGLIKQDRIEANTLSLLGLSLDVTRARALSIIGVISALAGLLTMGLTMLWTAERDPASAIRLKYGNLLVGASHVNLGPDRSVIELASIDDVAKMAERDGRMILHERQDSTDHYYVHDSNATYHYYIGNRPISPTPEVEVIPPDQTVEGWARTLDLSHKEDREHCHRVAESSLQLARFLGVDSAEMEHLRWGALLHDIGKIAIPDRILLKPGPLTNSEWRVMRLHPVYGYEMLAPIAFDGGSSLPASVEIPYCHHERWDGMGYPRGLRGREIPRAARIFAVIDTWDAMCSPRPYRPALPKDQARSNIRSLAGTHLDPEFVEAFLQLGLAS